MAQLNIKRRDGEEEEIALTENPLSIGKNDPARNIVNDVVLDDETVSRRHARIYYENGKYYIEDLGSRNHTFINDKSIKIARLHHGDRIRIGFNVLHFNSPKDSSRDSKTGKPGSSIKIDESNKDNTVDLNYLVLHRISEKLTSVADVQTFAKWIIELACQAVNAPQGTIILIDRKYQIYHKASYGSEGSYSRTIVDRVIEEKQPAITDAKTDPSISMIDRGINSVMCAPLLNEEQISGVIYVEDYSPANFNSRDLMLLTDIANHTAVGLDRLKLTEKVRNEALIRSGLESFLESLRKSEATNRALLDAIPDLMIQIDADGTILSFKQPKQEEFVLPTNLSARQVTDFLPGTPGQLTKQHITDALNTDHAQIFEFTLLVSGETRYYENRMIACGKDKVLSIMRDVTDRVRAEKEQKKLISELQEALAKIKSLRGLIPICASCKKIRDDKGYWNQLELYIQQHSDAEFSHSMCPECMKEWYPDQYKKQAKT